MTLRRRMTIAAIALIASLLIVATVSITGMIRVVDDQNATNEEYEELRLLSQVGVHVAHVRGLLDAPDANPVQIARRLDQATSVFGGFLEKQEAGTVLGEAHQEQEADYSGAVVTRLGNMVSLVEKLADRRDPVLYQELTTEADLLVKELDVLIKQADAAVRETRDNAHRDAARTVTILTVSSMVIVLVGMAVTIAQYRSVILPLRTIRQGVRRIASGKLDQRLTRSGDAEFVQLADDFNRMTAELESLYDDLEQRVETKSRQLVRSERLASVGFLAAGVAHEINNPLGIIAGHAELLQRHVRKCDDPQLRGQAEETLGIVIEEAFRCKEIVASLLSLSRSDDKPRERVDVVPLIHDVASLIAGLKQYRGADLRVDLPHDVELHTLGGAAELKQVVLNLVVNALDAVNNRADGRVIISAKTQGDMVQIEVSDNGRGMTPEVRDHVFEPFFTEKRGTGEPGTGLGLSIVHAIIDDYGGSIEASSDGPGSGSRFTVCIRAATEPVSP